MTTTHYFIYFSGVPSWANVLFGWTFLIATILNIAFIFWLFYPIGKHLSIPDMFTIGVLIGICVVSFLSIAVILRIASS